ncbi:MAG: tetratricopeptide repeat protein [Pseudomonadota bacterium]
MARAGSRRFLPIDRRLARAVALIACCALAGCDEGGMSAFGSQTRPQTTTAATSTIDPAYTVAPEERAPAVTGAATSKSDPDYDVFTERAAALAMREGKTEAALGHLSRLYDVRPQDKQVAYDYARHLRYLGAISRAEQVLNDALAVHPGDKLLRLEHGKLLLGAGRPSEAIAVLATLNQQLPDDPAVLQALAVAHDRRLEHAKAQALYARAMQSGRPSAALLNNAGLSHLLSGDLPKAVELLRRASTAPGANAQVRQNLALALTLSGQSEEARKFASEGAPPKVAREAIGVFKGIKSLDHPWSRVAGG